MMRVVKPVEKISIVDLEATLVSRARRLSGGDYRDKFSPMDCGMQPAKSAQFKESQGQVTACLTENSVVSRILLLHIYHG